MKFSTLLLVLGIVIPLRYGAAETVATLLYPRSEIVLSAATQGTLEVVSVEEGDTIKAGDVLARLESTDEQLLIDRLEKVIEKKRFDSEGLKQLLTKHMASETDAMQARLDMEIAEIDLKNARQKLLQKQVVAPIGGVVTRLDKKAGEWVQAGDKIVELIDVGEVHAMFYLPFDQVRTLRAGQMIEVLLPAVRSEPFAARLFFISPRVDASSGLITLKASINNHDRQLRPGLAGEVWLPAVSQDVR